MDSALSLRYYRRGTEPGFWDDIGLTSAQVLVDQMRGRWDYLDAPQLLKHLLGLRTERPKERTRIMYVWFDTPLADAAAHRGEIGRFGELIEKDDISFTAMSYQELFSRLVNLAAPHSSEWTAYMRNRYFSDQEAV